MPRIIRILKSRFRELSLGQFLELVLTSIYRSDPILIYGLLLDNLPNDLPPSTQDVVIERGDFNELQEFKAQFKSVPWELECHEYDGVDTFFIARSGKSLQHITWVYFWFDRNRILRLGEDESEFKFSLTFPEFRGRGLQPLVYQTIARQLAAEGIHRVFACVHAENRPSIRGIEKAGFSMVGSVTLRRILGIQVSKQADTSRL